MKKAQMSANTVMYALVAIVVILLLVWGYRTISDFGNKKTETETIIFKEKFSADIESMARQVNTLETKHYVLPSNVKEICFYDPSNSYLAEDIDSFPVSKELVKAGYNTFILTIDEVDAFNAGNIRTPKNFYCLDPIGSFLKVNITGRGEFVYLEAS